MLEKHLGQCFQKSVPGPNLFALWWSNCCKYRASPERNFWKSDCISGSIWANGEAELQVHIFKIFGP